MIKLINEVKQVIHAEDTEISDKVTTCTTTIPSTSNTLKNLEVNKSFQYSYIQREFNDKKDMVINIFSAYVEPLLKCINHKAFLQEWKLNLDSSQYKNSTDANMSKPYFKKDINLHDSESYLPTSIKDTIEWILFLLLCNILKIL